MLHLNTPSNPPPLPFPSSPPPHTHACIPRKGPDNLMPRSHPPLSAIFSPLFPTHSLSGANMQSISPPGGSEEGVLRHFLLKKKKALSFSYSRLLPSPPLSTSLQGKRGWRWGETLERELMFGRESLVTLVLVRDEERKKGGFCRVA